MEQSLASQVRAHLGSYIGGKCSLEAFEDWFVPNALSAADANGERSADELIYEIELRLAEFSHGDHTERELKQILQPLAVSHEARA